MFKNLSLPNLLNCLLNFRLFFFRLDLIESLDELWSSTNISSFENSGHESSSISESSDESFTA